MKEVLDTYEYRKGQTLEIVEGPFGVEAQHDGKTVGEFRFGLTENEYGPDSVQAGTIEVVEGYRRAGIALRMIKVVFDLHGMIALPSVNPMETDNRITTEGMRLWEAAEKMSWCTPLREKTHDAGDDGV
jgi:hypothetical protein